MCWSGRCAARSSWIYAGGTGSIISRRSSCGDEAFSVRIVALYQSQYVFGPQAGVQYYGEVTKCSPVCRGDITELRARKGTEQNLYYRFEIREWKRLNRPIAARESCFVKGLTSRFQLEHSARNAGTLASLARGIPALSEPETSARRHLHQRGGQRPWLCVPGFRGALRGRKDSCFGQGMGLRAVRDRRISSKMRRAVFRKLYRECVQRDSMNELSKI